MKKISSISFNNPVYLRDVLPAYDTDCPVSKKYFELHTETVSNGIKQELVEVDYPITQESVNSYADSSDYRNNPVQAVLNGQKKVNLGDITSVQDFINNNPSEALSIYKEVSQKLSELDLEKVARAQAQEKTTEVKANE